MTIQPLLRWGMHALVVTAGLTTIALQAQAPASPAGEPAAVHRHLDGDGRERPLGGQAAVRARRPHLLAQPRQRAAALRRVGPHVVAEARPAAARVRNRGERLRWPQRRSLARRDAAGELIQVNIGFSGATKWLEAVRRPTTASDALMDPAIDLLRALVAIDSVNPVARAARAARQGAIARRLADAMRAGRTHGHARGIGAGTAERDWRGRGTLGGTHADVLRPPRHGRRHRHDASVRSRRTRRARLRPRLAGHEGRRRRDGGRRRGRGGAEARTPAAWSCACVPTRRGRASAPTRW